MSALLELFIDVGGAGGEDIIGDWKAWDGGPGDVWIWGDLGGGQIDLHAAIDEVAPVVVCETSASTGVTKTSSAVTKFNFKQSTKIRAVLTGSTRKSSGIYVKVN